METTTLLFWVEANFRNGKIYWVYLVWLILQISRTRLVAVPSLNNQLCGEGWITYHFDSMVKQYVPYLMNHDTHTPTIDCYMEKEAHNLASETLGVICFSKGMKSEV